MDIIESLRSEMRKRISVPIIGIDKNIIIVAIYIG